MDLNSEKFSLSDRQKKQNKTSINKPATLKSFPLALLGLPCSLSEEEKILKAEAVMNELDLTHCKDTTIGGPLLRFRGVSGGEWKRVSIGQQLLTNPSLLLVDEPTSGIYSENSEEDINATKQVLLSAFESNLACQVKMELQMSRDSFHHNSEDEIFGQRFKERKHEQLSLHKMCHVLALSFFAGFLWRHSGVDQMQDRVGLFFYYTQFCGFFPMFQSIFTIPQDRGMIIKERSFYMYRFSSYFIASNLVDLPLQLALPTLFVTITY
ncbi:ABC transporter G family member 14, partial [Mucuna pruriens]